MLQLYVGLTLVLYSANVNAQKYPYSHLTVDDGLAQSSVYGIYQDKQGFMWFGTSDGLSRYDGNILKTYKHNPDFKVRGTGNFYGDNTVEDSSGNLYFSGRTGMVFYNRKKDKINRFYPQNDTAKFNYFIQVLALKHDTLWFTDSHKYFYAYNINTKQISTYQASSSFPKTYFFHASMDSFGRIWYTTKGCITSFNIYSKAITFHLADYCKNFESNLMNDVVAFNKDQLLISTNYFIIKYNLQKNTYTKVLPTGIDRLYGRVICDKNGVIYIGTLNAGLRVVSPNAEPENIIHIENQEQSLGSNIVLGMCMDKTGNLWMGCDGFGITKINTRKPNFTLYRKNVPNGYNFTTNFIKCFLVDNDKVWFGTHEGGLNELNRKTKTSKSYKFNWVGANTISFIYKASPTCFFLGTAAGVLMFNPANGVTQKIPFKNPIIAINGQNFAQAICASTVNANTYWVATSMGIYQFTYHHNKATALVENTICGRPNAVSIHQSKNGILYCGNLEYGYLYRFIEKPNGELIQKNSIFNGNIIRSFFEDTIEKVLWMASEKGLIKFNLVTDKYEYITVNDGLKDNFLYAVIPGAKNQLWLSSNKGLMCYNTVLKKVRGFSPDDGLQSNEFNTGCYYRSKAGELFFGGINGFNSFYPNNITKNQQKPNVVLTKLMVNDEEYLKDENPVVLSSLQLSHYQNTLSFDFAALEFTNQPKNEYRYLLAGVDKKWVNSGTHHIARYSVLPAGEYNLLVMASNNDGVWSSAKSLVKIKILSPFWLRWWFIALEVFGLIFTSYLVIRYITMRELKSRIKQMDAINQERIRIAKDMHDDLGSGISKIAIITQLLKNKNTTDIDVKKQILKIEHTAHELVDNMGQIVWTMNANNDTIENFLAYVRMYVFDFFEDTGVKCVINFEEVDSDFEMSQLLRRNLFLVIKETLNNIVKHANASIVTLNFSIINNKVSIVITDNGIGFDIQVTRRFGNGLANMKKRLDPVKATCQIDSIVGVGTTTTLTWKV